MRCPGPLGSCSRVCPLSGLCRACGVLGHLAPVHRCARSVCCVACAVSWATWLLFTGVPARCVALCMRCPGPPGSCSPLCPLGGLCCACGVLGPLAPVRPCSRSVCCVVCAVSWAAWLLFIAATVSDAHPLPYIEEEIAKREKGKLFTLLDLRHGFHQMPLRKENRHLTAMCTPCGTIQGMLCRWVSRMRRQCSRR